MYLMLKNEIDSDLFLTASQTNSNSGDNYLLGSGSGNNGTAVDLMHVGSDADGNLSSLLAPATSLSHFHHWQLPQVFNLPQVVFFGIVGCVVILVLLVISLICHHIRSHISLLKELERFGYHPDDEWKNSALHRLSVWVKRHDDWVRASYIKDDQELSVICDSGSGHHQGESNKGRHRSTSDTSVTTPGSGVDDVQEQAMKVIEELVINTLNPSLVLHSIAEEDNPANLFLPEYDFSQGDPTHPRNVYFDPEMLRQALAHDLIEMHQQMRDGPGELSEEDENYATAILDDELRNIFADQSASNSDAQFMSPFSDGTPFVSTAFVEDNSTFETPFIDVHKQQPTMFSFDDDEITKCFLAGSELPPNTAAPGLEAVAEEEAPLYNYQPQTRSFPIQQQQQPTHASSYRPLSLTQSLSPHTQQQPHQPRVSGSSSSSISANSLMLTYAKRIGDAYLIGEP